MNRFYWNRLLIVSLLVFSFSSSVFALEGKNDWLKVSHGTATWLWFDVYDAELYLQDRADLDGILQNQKPLALQLCYKQEIKAGQIVEASQKVLPKSLPISLQRSINELHFSFEDVKPGDCYRLEYSANGTTSLILNEKTVFESENKQLKPVYFGIWLGENPISEDLRDKLLNPQS